MQPSLLIFSPFLALGAGLLADPSGPSGDGVSAASESTVFAWADLDGDGLDDAAAIDSTGTVRLLANAGNGRLHDVSAAAGLAGVTGATFALWKDYDDNGAPDLLVGTESGPSRLFANRAGSLIEVTETLGLNHLGADRSARWVDYDRDGLEDLHVVTSLGNHLYHAVGSAESGTTDAFERIDLPAVVAPHSGVEALLLQALQPGASGALSMAVSSGAAGSSGPAASTLMAPTPTTFSTSTVVADNGRPFQGATVISAVCPPSLEDQVGGECLQASSIPTLGDLYPLSQELFVDSTTGYVGLGTTSPDELLQIGEYFLTNEDAFIELRTTGGGSEFKQGVKMRSSNPFFGFDVEHDDGLKGLNVIRYDNDFGVASGDSAMFIDRQTGTVGFGTTDVDPNFRTMTDGRALFDLSEGAGTGSIAVTTPGGEVGVTAISFGGTRWDVLYEDGVMTQGGGTTAEERMHMTQAGDVGFGTKTPGARLDVEGEVWIGGDMNGSPDGGLTTFRSTGEIASLVSGYAGGYQIGLVDLAQSAVVAGMFLDDVTQESSLFATVKNFRVDNPDDLNTDLVYACVEGPEAAMYVRGSAELQNGVAIVELPRHFELMAAAEGLTVQLTPNSAASLGLAVVEKGTGEFRVQELGMGRGNYAFDWEAKAVRKGYEDYEVVRPKLRLQTGSSE